MPTIVDNYMNDDYKQFYETERTKELYKHKDYNAKQIYILEQELKYYCNQKSIIEDYQEGGFSFREVKEYIEDNKFENLHTMELLIPEFKAEVDKRSHNLKLRPLIADYYQNIPVPQPLNDNYMNDNYKQFYKTELEKELKVHTEYNEEQTDILKKKLKQYCNQMSIIEDYQGMNDLNYSKLSPEEIKEYIKDGIVYDKRGFQDYDKLAITYIYEQENQLKNCILLPSAYGYKNIKIIEETKKINSAISDVDEKFPKQIKEITKK